MDYLQNHVWCSSSYWGKGEYSCRHVVSMNYYESGHKSDWKKIIDESADLYVSEIDLARNKKIYGDEIDAAKILAISTKTVIGLNPDVLEWLHQNVADSPAGIKGWDIGSAEYRSHNSTSISIFFYRKKDAMAFIKQWSQYKKPIRYTQYFTDVRKKLDLTTLRYVSI